MPVDGASVVGHAVRHMDNNLIAPVGNNRRSGHGAVDGEDDTLDAVRSRSDVLNIEPVLPRDAGIRYDIVVVGGRVVVAPA